MGLPQMFERTKDLSGQIKAAREMVSMMADELEAKEHAATLARQAYDKATAALMALIEERDTLAIDMAAEVRRVGDCQHLRCKAAKGEPTLCCDCGAVVEDPPYAEEGPISSPPSVTGDFNSVFVEGADFQAQMLQNGADKVTAAFEQATR